MKKIIKKTCLAFALVGVIGFSNNSNAQAFEMESQNFSLGYGFGNFGNLVFQTYETYTEYSYAALGPIFVKYEYAISDKFGIGVNAVYLNGKATFDTESGGTMYKNEITRTGYNIMLRFNWHFGNHDIIDPYFGIAAGYRNNNYSTDFGDPTLEDIEINTLFPLGLEATFGSRFMFADNLGAYVEVGLARAIVQVGLTGTF